MAKSFAKHNHNTPKAEPEPYRPKRRMPDNNAQEIAKTEQNSTD